MKCNLIFVIYRRDLIIISIEEKALSKKEEYEAFLADLKEIADKIGAEYGKKVAEDAEKLLKDVWLTAIPLVGGFFSGKLMGDALNKVREQMLMFAITHIYLNHLDSFMKE